MNNAARTGARPPQTRRLCFSVPLSRARGATPTRAARALEPDLRGLAALGGTHQIRGFCTVSLETVEAASRIHSRFFAPHYGIPEDIVTGSVHSSLGVWLLEAGHLAATTDRAIFTAEQGDGLGRPGRLIVELTVAGGRATRVGGGGRAVTVLRRSLHLG